MQVSSIIKSSISGGEVSSIVGSKFRRSETTRIRDAVQALALCHNVTPVYETFERREDIGKYSRVNEKIHDCLNETQVSDKKKPFCSST